MVLMVMVIKDKLIMVIINDPADIKNLHWEKDISNQI